MTKKISRRHVLHLSLWGAVGGVLAACNSQTPQAPTITPAASPTPLPLPTTTPPPILTPTEGVTPTTQPPPTAEAPLATEMPTQTPTSAPTATPTPHLNNEMAQAANQFLDSLNTEQQAKASYAFNDAERQRWHWTTPRNFPRNGLPLREMDEAQQALAHTLLRVSSSEVGYQKALNIISLQIALGNDPQLYYVSIFGTPGEGSWGWRIEGHHLSRHFTLVDNYLTVTPFFNGAWPTITDSNLRAMAREEDAARELVLSLDEHKQAQVIFSEHSLSRHVTQNQAYVAPLETIGLPLGEFDTTQQALVLEIIQAYLGGHPEHIALNSFERITQAGLENIRFAWAGSLEPRRRHYYRLQGPTFLLEFDNSRNSGTHIHSVWRDFEQDFGQNLL